MNRHHTTITSARILAIACLFLLATLAFAHGGLEHVLGTVTKVSDTSVTVKTTAGKLVEVAFDTKTTFSRSDHPIQKSEIKVGDRVVIHAAKNGANLVAHTVEIGTATATKAAKH